jgi:hypothetical protein
MAMARNPNALDRRMNGRDRTLKPHAARGASGSVLPMQFRKGDVTLNLFTAIATLGTALDITLQELRVESFFPMDHATAAILRGWAR